ncbi:uncharacterized protein LOC134848509 [Symsagittifera roscoffensis]|uniref:uncharacterized protein LOC134848509 n=1 Tax=Symsagittifera roscoffensis TaxID=84072 RepID=UPI00307C5101
MNLGLSFAFSAIFLGVTYGTLVSEPGCPPGGFIRISGADMGKCYKLVLNSTADKQYIDSDFVKMHEAYIECTLQQGWIARPKDRPEAAALKNWLVANHNDLFDANSPKGVWMGYRRAPFPVGDLDYNTEVKPERINPKAYYDMYLDCPRVVMNPALWRNSSNAVQEQPNDGGKAALDKVIFDERCVALKKVSDNKNVGLDDYDCEDGLVHATLCEACFVPEEPA